MARIIGIDLPSEKRIDIGLTVIYGVGRNNAVDILKEAQVDPAKRVKDLKAEEITRIQGVVEKIAVEGALKKEIAQNIERLKSIKAYRGIRHIHGLPARGQRTRSNARTKRGKRRTIGALKKKDMTRVGGAPEEKNES